MSDDATTLPPPARAYGPLGTLALALSGGGYRAAAFHLGTLRFLDRARLLGDVGIISTVSGGTIAGMAWTVSLLDGRPFNEFYADFSAYLKRTNVIGEALDGLTANREAGSHSYASLIRAAADVYARDDLFGDRRFGEVLGADGLQLTDAVFNSTEFHTGLDFRFRASDDPYVILGNNNYRLKRAVAQHVRLADIVAASSCFPGGFEPLVFPQQFRWPAEYPLDAALNDLGTDFDRGLPLMDGGIYDNQGAETLAETYAKSPDVTLLISDVDTQDSDIYNVPPNPTRRGFLTLNSVWRLAYGLFVLTLAAAAVLAWHGYEAARDGGWRLQDYFLYLVPLGLSLSVATALVWLRARLSDVNELIEDQVTVNAWPSLRRLTVVEFAQMLVLRGTSLLALTSSIFMKRVRGLIYDSIFRDVRFKGRRMSNLIYTLSDNHPKLYRDFPWLEPKPHLVTLSQQGCQMPTTLWFTSDTQFNVLSCAGEATVCFALLRHIVLDRAGEYEQPGTPLHDLYERLRGEWTVFNRDALWLPCGQPVGKAMAAGSA